MFVAIHGLSAVLAWCAVTVVVDEAFAGLLVCVSVSALGCVLFFVEFAVGGGCAEFLCELVGDEDCSVLSGAASYGYVLGVCVSYLLECLLDVLVGLWVL